MRTSLIYGGPQPQARARRARSGATFYANEIRCPVQVGDLAAALLGSRRPTPPARSTSPAPTPSPAPSSRSSSRAPRPPAPAPPDRRSTARSTPPGAAMIDRAYAEYARCWREPPRRETSPYLLQHADNPVDWYPWGEEALARARDENRPILLSIGYSACHWCHVMEHESFEDDATAALMNEQFVTSRSTARSGPTSTRSTWRPSSRCRATAAGR